MKPRQPCRMAVRVFIPDHVLRPRNDARARLLRTLEARRLELILDRLGAGPLLVIECPRAEDPR